MPRPKAVLFDLFHTLACVAPPSQGGSPVAETLGVDAEHWRRHYYEEDTFGRCLGRVKDSVEIMRLCARAVDPDVSEERILAATSLRSRSFERALVDVDPSFLDALDDLRAAGIRIALVSDAGHDDVEAWPRSPLAARMDVAAFSHELGVRKPHPDIYRHALDRLRVEAGAAVFVGDGGSDELRGARAVGMRAVLVTRLIEQWWPGRTAPRVELADEVHDDVATFVRSMLGSTAGEDDA